MTEHRNLRHLHLQRRSIGLSGPGRAVGLSELPPLKINDKFLPGLAKRTIAVVPLHGIKFLDKPPQTFGNRLAGTCKKGGGTKISVGTGGGSGRAWDRLKNGRVLGEITVYRIEDGVLIISFGLVAGNPGHAQFIQDRRNILVLEFN